MADTRRHIALAISINLINIVVMKDFWNATMRSQMGKKLTANQVDLILHAAILAASFAAVALAAVLGGSY